VKFSQAHAELKSVGITLETVPGEYLVYRRGSSMEGFRTDDLQAAVEHGRALATIGHALRELPPLGPVGRSGRKAKMHAHNRKIAAKRAKAARDG
jgi:hypothetical protein